MAKLTLWLQDVKSEYKENLMKLNAFVMVRFNNDTMVIPVESQVSEEKL